MSELPDKDLGFQLVNSGYCSITLLTDGEFVQTPWVVPQQPLGGQRFQLHKTVVQQLARAIDLVPEGYYEQLVDQRDAKIEELEAIIKGQQEEMEGMRYAAERYWSSELAAANQKRRGKNEERIYNLSNAIHEKDEEIKRLKEQLTKEVAA